MANRAQGAAWASLRTRQRRVPQLQLDTFSKSFFGAFYAPRRACLLPPGLPVPAPVRSRYGAASCLHAQPQLEAAVYKILQALQGTPASGRRCVADCFREDSQCMRTRRLQSHTVKMFPACVFDACRKVQDGTGRCESCDIPGCDKCADVDQCARCGSGFEELSGRCIFTDSADGASYAKAVSSMVKMHIARLLLVLAIPVGAIEVSGGRRCCGKQSASWESFSLFGPASILPWLMSKSGRITWR